MGFLGFGKDELGEVPVPGEATLTLPAGSVALRYVEDRAGRGTKPGSGKPWAGPGEDLEITVASADGERIAVNPPRSVQRGMGRTIHQEVGSVEVPAAGEYSVSAAMTAGDGNLSPRLVLRA